MGYLPRISISVSRLKRISAKGDFRGQGEERTSEIPQFESIF